MEATSLSWSAQQTAALDAVRVWLENRACGKDQRQCFYLAGYAGSGKTTLAREFAKALPGQVEFAAFTGKAANVLRMKGCGTARTIHSLIYIPVGKSRAHAEELQELLFEAKAAEDPAMAERLRVKLEEAKEQLRRPSWCINLDSDLKQADLLIVDEVSMVDQRMGEDLCSFRKPILVLGDPAQLPPVAQSQGYFTRNEPDFMLTEVHRQAQDSPVLRLATMVRRGEGLDLGDYGSSRVVAPKTLKVADVVENFDQIICGRNSTRHALNKAVREFMGQQGKLPQIGDKLICLRNDKNSDMLNGSFWEVIAEPALEDDGDTMRLVLRSLDEGGPGNAFVTAWRHHFEGRPEQLSPWRVRDHLEFDFGYAITCHKAQGSQWPRVLVKDESSIARADRNKWLYTALTRASESVTIVQP